MKKTIKILLVVSFLFTLTMCVPAGLQNETNETSRVHMKECGVGDYGKYDIIEVYGKEYLCNYYGGIILLGESSGLQNDTLSRVRMIECGVGDYGKYDIIEVYGKEYLCNYYGGIISLGETKDTIN